MNKLEAAIGKLADAIDPEEHASSVMLDWAASANQLAEARAWLSRGDQPHGGSTVVKQA